MGEPKVISHHALRFAFSHVLCIKENEVLKLV